MMRMDFHIKCMVNAKKILFDCELKKNMKLAGLFYLH